MAITLYSWPQSSGTRVAWALEELGVPYEYIALDASKGEHRAASYLQIHPHGKVPALVDGEQTFFESGAILLHLGHKYGVDKRLWPEAGGQARADALSWTVWSMTELGPYLLQLLYHGLDTPVSYQPQDRSKAAAAYCRSQLDRCLAVMQTRLESRENLLGEFTLADVAPASWLQIGTGFGLSIADHPRVAAWLERCNARSALQRAR